ncbi:MAG: DNA polymerase III subunit gamma/tau [Henriciella sp.]|nr:DNA polymerase III subunit gamma/tau [Henriciella sp.]
MVCQTRSPLHPTSSGALWVLLYKTCMSTKTTSKNYQVLARKYRPLNFEDMIGQEPLVKTLTNAFKTGRVAHAFMLTGVRGIGKTTTARLLARALNYESDDHDGPSVKLEPPGIHCDAINRSSHLDVMEMDAASRTGVGDIREILDSVRYGPVEARYKVYIIDEVHMLSAQAFNALLKTLEEPPDHAKFIFATTEIRKIPITVLSRCQRFDLRRVEADELCKHLANICVQEKANIAEDGLMLIARAAEGSVRDGLSLLDQAIVQAEGDKEVSAEDIRIMLGLADRTRVLGLFASAVNGDAKGALIEVRSQYTDGADPTVIVRDLLDICHEVSRAKALGADAEFDMAPDQITRLYDLAGRLTMGQITRAWQMLLSAHADVRTAPDPLAAAEMALLRLAVAGDLPPPELAAQLLAGLKDVKNAPKASGSSGAGSGETSAETSSVAPIAHGNTAPQLETKSAPQAQQFSAPKLELNTLEDLVAAVPKNQTGLRYDIEKYIRPIRFEPGTFVFSCAPNFPKDLEYQLRAWVTDATARPWHSEVDTKTQGEPSLLERRRDAQTVEKDAEDNHPVAVAARALFPGVEIEFRGRPSISNVINADFAKPDEET